MDLLSTGINALVVGAVGLILAWLGKGRFDAVDRRFDAIDRRFDAIENRFDAMRSDLTQVALAVGVRPRAENA
jgi:hypothetical protein